MAVIQYTITNIQKYAGKPDRVIYDLDGKPKYFMITARSSWEAMYMGMLDNSPLVASWISEPKMFNIRYRSPIDKQMHAYWPDFFIQYVNNAREIVEIKPLKEALVENAKSTYDKLMLVKNMAKWQAAAIFAKSIGARFRVLTEKDLFKQRTKQSSRSTNTSTRTKSTVKTVKTRGTSR